MQGIVKVPAWPDPRLASVDRVAQPLLDPRRGGSVAGGARVT